MSSVLEAKDLVKSFRDAPVLGGLNLHVPEGSVYGVVGPNRAGKTTTIKIAMNILQPGQGIDEFRLTDFAFSASVRR